MSRMNRSDSGEKKSLSPLQQKAVRVLVVCAAALLATILAVALVLHLLGGSQQDDGISEDYDPDSYQLDTESGAILAQTDDAGDSYQNDTLFVGDSNTVRMYSYGLISIQQYVGAEGMGIQSLTTNRCVSFSGDSTMYTIPEAIAKMKPRRILITMGTNNVDGSMTAEEFVSEYRSAVQAIQSAYPYCDIIVNAIPPIPADHSAYPSLKMQTIDEFNQALLQMCEEDGLKFLNSSEELKAENGFGKTEYFATGDIHFTKAGITALLDYYRTHALESEDRRPDTDNIPTRVATPTSSSTASTPTPSDASGAKMKANYYVENDAGYIRHEDYAESSMSFDVTENDSITVTAVPKEGYTFVAWSDGNTNATRTDTGFKQSLSVTARFSSSTASISITPGSATINAGENVTFSAQVTMDGSSYDASSVIWTINNEQEATASSFSYTFNTAGTYTVVAYFTMNEKTVSANATVVVNSVAAVPATASPTAQPTTEPVTESPTQEPTEEPTPTPETEQ